MSVKSPPEKPTSRDEMTREWLCGGILAAAFVLFASLSWRTWPDILVDFGHELYVPWRLSVGDVLYRDIAWVMGPLSQYANSWLFRLFGVSLTTLIVANLVLLAGIIAMLYYLLRQCGTRWSATCACLFFLAVFAFGQYSMIGNYNYVCPYRYDMTHGLVLGLVNLLCLVRFGRTQQIVWLAAAGLCLGLLSLTKVEMTLAACLTTAAALPLFAWQTRSEASAGDIASEGLSSSLLQRLSAMGYWWGVIVTAALVPMAIAVVTLSSSLGWTGSINHIFRQYQLIFVPEASGGSGFYRAILGWDRPTENLLNSAFATVIVLAVAVAAYVLEMMAGRTARANVWAGILGVTVAFCGLFFMTAKDWHALPESLPLLLPPVILFAGRRALRAPTGTDSILFLLAIYGLGLLAKISLRVSWGHYGFVLAMPGALVLIHVSLHTIPTGFSRYHGTGRFFQATMAGLLTACGLSLAWSWIQIDQIKAVAVGEQGDKFYADAHYDGRTLPTLNTLNYLKNAIQADESLVVFPEGVMLNYLLRKRNPTPYLLFNPWESSVHGGDDHIADAVIQAAPDYAVIVTMDMTIHGRGNFGSPEFGGRIVQFLNAHYDVVHQEMSNEGLGGEFVSTVFKRREKPKPTVGTSR